MRDLISTYVPTGQKPDGPDEGIAIRQVYLVLPLKGVSLRVKVIQSTRLKDNTATEQDRKI